MIETFRYFSNDRASVNWNGIRIRAPHNCSFRKSLNQRSQKRNFLFIRRIVFGVCYRLHLSFHVHAQVASHPSLDWGRAAKNRFKRVIANIEKGSKSVGVLFWLHYLIRNSPVLQFDSKLIDEALWLLWFWDSPLRIDLDLDGSDRGHRVVVVFEEDDQL